jgi:hypothetical protein
MVGLAQQRTAAPMPCAAGKNGLFKFAVISADASEAGKKRCSSSQ